MNTSILESLYTHPSRRVIAHVLFWILWAGVQWYSQSISFTPFNQFPTSASISWFVVGILNFLVFYYTWVYFVFPLLTNKKKWWMGLILSFILAGFHAMLDVAKEEWILKACASCMKGIESVSPDYSAFLHHSFLSRVLAKWLTLGSLIGLLFSLAIPFSVKMMIRLFREQNKSLELSKENIRLEFDFLRSQVKPHFLFNTLNNLYALILKGDKQKSAATVSELSEFLRYSLYDSNEKTVAFSKEIEMIRNYLSLERLRLNHVDVQFQLEDDGTLLVIPPLLLMPLVENAFSHCPDEQGAIIHIQATIKKGLLRFKVRNTKGSETKTRGGIGLTNVSKRLQMHYSKGSHLKTSETDKEYFQLISIQHEGVELPGSGR